MRPRRHPPRGPPRRRRVRRRRSPAARCGTSRLRFAGAAPAGEFRRLPGVSELAVDGPELRFLLAGEPTEVVRAAGRHRLLDIEIARPSLEEAFVAAYGHTLEEVAA